MTGGMETLLTQNNSSFFNVLIMATLVLLNEEWVLCFVENSL